MDVSTVFKYLTVADFEVLTIKDNVITARRKWVNGKGLETVTIKVHSDHIIHERAFENSQYEWVDLRIKSERVDSYIKEEL